MATDDKRMRTKLLDMARTDLQAGDVRRAVRHYKRLVALEPDNPNFLMKMGDLSLRNSDEHDAVDAYARAAAIFARDSIDEKAIALYKRALELDSKRYDLWHALADSYIRIDRKEEALASLTIAAEALTRDDRPEEAAEFRKRLEELGSYSHQEPAPEPFDEDLIPSESELFQECVEEVLEGARTGDLLLVTDAFRAALTHRPARVAELRSLFTGLDMSDVDAVKQALMTHLEQQPHAHDGSGPDLAGFLSKIQDCREYLDGMEILYRRVAEIYRESSLQNEGT